MAKIVDAEEKRAHIVDATWRVVAQHGLDVVTMRMIAAEAGCTTGMVTHYFANKDEILEELVGQVSRRSGRRLAAAVDGKVGVAALRELLVQSLPLDNDRNAEWRVWLALWNRSVAGGKLAAEWDRRGRAWMKLLRSTVEKAVALGDLPPQAATDSSVEAMSAISFGLSIATVISPRRPSKRAIVRVVDEFLESRYGGRSGSLQDLARLTAS